MNRSRDFGVPKVSPISESEICATPSPGVTRTVPLGTPPVTTVADFAQLTKALRELDTARDAARLLAVRDTFHAYGCLARHVDLVLMAFDCCELSK